MWERKELKKRGLEDFKANYWRCVLIGILLTMFVAGASVGTGRTVRSGTDGSGTAGVANNSASAGTQIDVTEEEIEAVVQDPEFQLAMLEVLAQIGVLLFTVWLICTCLRLLVFNPIEVGCRGFFTRNTGIPAGMDEVKVGFHPYGRNVAAMFLRDLFLFLWGMLFLIPGIIKRYSYRMVPYILADDPTIGALDAITLSREMMNGHKWKTFVLDLSFIGWDLLTVFTCGLVGVFYANPYQFSTGAELYQALKNQ